MKNSKLYYIIYHYLDLSYNDNENIEATYNDIKNGYNAVYKMVNDKKINSSEIREIAEEYTKKGIDNFFQ